VTQFTIDVWLRAAVADAEARRLPELKPLLESLAQALRALRAADFNDRADGLLTVAHTDDTGKGPGESSR
jgi:hypothetical protein